MSQIVWIVETTGDRRFPYRVRLERNGAIHLMLYTQNRWPGPGSQIFCLRDDGDPAAEPLEEVERVPVASMTRFGRRLSLVLDRGQRKRC